MRILYRPKLKQVVFTRIKIIGHFKRTFQEMMKTVIARKWLEICEKLQRNTTGKRGSDFRENGMNFDIARPVAADSRSRDFQQSK